MLTIQGEQRASPVLWGLQPRRDDTSNWVITTVMSAVGQVLGRQPSLGGRCDSSEKVVLKVRPGRTVVQERVLLGCGRGGGGSAQ